MIPDFATPGISEALKHFTFAKLSQTNQTSIPSWNTTDNFNMGVFQFWYFYVSKITAHKITRVGSSPDLPSIQHVRR
jgi:hypothetical protein